MRRHRALTQKRVTERKSPRRGIAVLETIVSFVPLILLLFAGIQFALTSAVANTIAAAAHEGARCSANGGDLNEVSAEVSQVLSVHGISIGTGVRLVIQDDAGAIQSQGDFALTSHLLGAPPPAGTVRSLLIVDVDATPAPNLLAAYCVDFSNRQFECSSVTTLFKECP